MVEGQQANPADFSPEELQELQRRFGVHGPQPALAQLFTAGLDQWQPLRRNTLEQIESLVPTIRREARERTLNPMLLGAILYDEIQHAKPGENSPGWRIPACCKPMARPARRGRADPPRFAARRANPRATPTGPRATARSPAQCGPAAGKMAGSPPPWGSLADIFGNQQRLPRCPLDRHLGLPTQRQTRLPGADSGLHARPCPSRPDLWTHRSTDQPGDLATQQTRPKAVSLVAVQTNRNCADRCGHCPNPHAGAW